MSKYQVHLLLEALVRVYSLSELEDCQTVVTHLCRHLSLSEDEGEIMVEGAVQLKRLRMEVGHFPSERTPIQ